MFGSMKSGASVYAKVGVETDVLAASPHKLIAMLFEGADVALGKAVQQMANRDIAGKGASISKAINIIQNGLHASLDMKAGGEIATNLASLYEYMVAKLLEANLKNSTELVAEVRRLLGEIKSAWSAIDPAAKPANDAAAPSAPPARSLYDSLSVTNRSYVSA